MTTVPLNVPVDAWNAVKFVVLQFLVSVLFAETWSFFVSRRTARLLEQGNTVSILTTNLGRLTPANVVHDRRSWRHHDRAPARALVLIVNAVVIVFALLTEYGSSSVPRKELRQLQVASAFSIMSSQHQQDRLLRNTKKVPAFAVQNELSPSAFSALNPCNDCGATGSRPAYRLYEHLVNDTDQFVLERNENNDLILKDVCGLNPTNENSQCSKLIEQSLGIPHTPVGHFTVLIFNVTDSHGLDVPEYTSQASLDKVVSVKILHSYASVQRRTTALPIPFQPRQLITGACSGSGQARETQQGFQLFQPYWGRMELCVLTDTEGLVFLIARLENKNLPEVVLRNLTLGIPANGTSWDTVGSSVAMAANTDVILTFRPAMKLEPLFALACVVRLSRKLQRIQFLHRLPVGGLLRLSLLLRALGLVGPYATRREVNLVHKEDGIAAVDKLFFAGVALLIGLTILLLMLAAFSRAKTKLLLPLDVKQALQLLYRIETTNSQDILLDSEPVTLPTFTLENGAVKVVCPPRKQQNEDMDGVGEVENQCTNMEKGSSK